MSEDAKEHPYGAVIYLPGPYVGPRDYPKANAGEEKFNFASIEDLTMSLFMDLIPDDESTTKDFYFTNCHEIKDERMLLGVYQILYKNLKVSKDHFHSWMVAKEIHKNVVRLFDKTYGILSHYYYRLLKHPHIFHPEDVSAPLDVEAYVESHEIDKCGQPGGSAEEKLRIHSEMYGYEWY